MRFEDCFLRHQNYTISITVNIRSYLCLGKSVKIPLHKKHWHFDFSESINRRIPAPLFTSYVCQITRKILTFSATLNSRTQAQHNVLFFFIPFLIFFSNTLGCVCGMRAMRLRRVQVACVCRVASCVGAGARGACVDRPPLSRANNWRAFTFAARPARFATRFAASCMATV